MSRPKRETYPVLRYGFSRESEDEAEGDDEEEAVNSEDGDTNVGFSDEEGKTI